MTLQDWRMILAVLRKKHKIPDETYWRGQKPVARLILNKIKRGDTVLEIGIGKGGVTRYLLQKQPYLNIIGFDINKSSLKKASELLKKKCKGKYKVLKLSQDIDLAKKFGKERFDFVISSGVMDYAKDPDKVIRNIKKVLKPAGYLAFTLFDNLSSGDYNGKNPKQRYTSAAGIRTWGYRDFYVKKLLKKIGFKLISISLFKKLHTNTHIELSHNEIRAIRENLDDPYDDHFVILAREK